MTATADLALPAAFPGLSRAKESKTTKESQAERDTDVDLDDVDSPTMWKETRYDGLVFGRLAPGLPPFARPSGDGKAGKARWLMPRSNGGAFSSSSDASFDKSAG